MGETRIGRYGCPQAYTMAGAAAQLTIALAF
jgi:hypothetical protein